MKRLRKLKNAEHAGKYEPKDKYKVYSKVNVVIVPSVWNEIYGLVLDEALSTNRFVIISNRGALPERIINGKNGLIFDPDKKDDFYNKIKMILENPRDFINEERIKETKTWLNQEEHVNIVTGIYKSLIKSNNE